LNALRILAVAALTACAARAEPPSPDRPAATRPPDLTGASVMVLPAQAAPGAGTLPDAEPVPGLDRELSFWLAESAPRVEWVFPPALERALQRSPSLDIRLHALAVSSFHRAEVEIIGDPLFGDLRALGALVDARYALLPVAAAFVPAADSAGQGRVELRVALIDTRGGRVLWFGALAGQTGPAGSPATVATAAQAVARMVAR
jgi:hypothetical protein